MAALAVAFSYLVLASRPTQAVPLPPHVFYGTVTVGGVGAPDGTVIRAVIAAASCDPADCNFAFSSTGDHIPRTVDGTYGFDSNTFQVLADDTDTTDVKEGGLNGETIQFFVGTSTEVAGTAIFSSGATELNLSVSSLPPPPPRHRHRRHRLRRLRRVRRIRRLRLPRRPRRRPRPRALLRRRPRFPFPSRRWSRPTRRASSRSRSS